MVDEKKTQNLNDEQKDQLKRNILRLLVETNQVRIEESEVRPRVEMWVDEFSAWVASKKAEKEGEFSPHFGPGWQ